jgi:hypothetical protein
MTPELINFIITQYGFPGLGLLGLAHVVRKVLPWLHTYLERQNAAQERQATASEQLVVGIAQIAVRLDRVENCVDGIQDDMIRLYARADQPQPSRNNNRRASDKAKTPAERNA